MRKTRKEKIRSQKRYYKENKKICKRCSLSTWNYYGKVICLNFKTTLDSKIIKSREEYIRCDNCIAWNFVDIFDMKRSRQK